MAQDQGAQPEAGAPQEDTVLAGLRAAIESGIIQSVKKTILTCMLVWVLQRETRQPVHLSGRHGRNWRTTMTALIVPAGYVAYRLHAWHLLMQIPR